MPTDTSKKSWRDRAQKPRRRFDPQREMNKEPHPTDDDIVLNHPDNKSNIRIKDNGTIQMFAGNNLGLKLDPNSNSIQFFGDSAKFMTSTVHFQTDSGGLMWNYMPFNEALADPFTELVTANTVPFGIGDNNPVSGTDALKRILSNTGTHMTGSGPTTPGTASMINSPAVGLEGKRAYKGIKQLNKLNKMAKGIKDITGSFGDLI